MIFRPLLIFAVLVTVCYRINECRTLHRKERSLVDLARMVKLTTGRKGTDFVPYGNWCGIGGSGKVMDAVDGCCQTHDNCYVRARDKGVCKAIFSLYLAKYTWKYEKGEIMCSIPEDANECDEASCYCDKEVALCLAKNIDSYQEDHRYVRSVLKS